MTDLKLDQLNAFLDVVELGTFTAAAERLGVSQPAVSLQIGQLEKKVGVKLLERVGKKVIPTAAGLRMVDHARSIRRDVSLALADMEMFEPDTFGRVRIGTGATACIYLLPPVLKELRDKLPDLEITIFTGNTADILKQIEHNDIDLGLVTMPAPGRMFNIDILHEDPLVLVTSPEYREAPKSTTPKILAKLPLISFETGGNMQRVVDDWFRKAGVARSANMTLSNVEAIKELVGAGLGHAILPKSAFLENRRDVRFRLQDLEPPLTRDLAIVVRHDKPRNKGLRETLRCLEKLRM